MYTGRTFQVDSMAAVGCKSWGIVEISVRFPAGGSRGGGDVDDLVRTPEYLEEEEELEDEDDDDDIFCGGGETGGDVRMAPVGIWRVRSRNDDVVAWSNMSDTSPGGVVAGGARGSMWKSHAASWCCDVMRREGQP